MAELCTSGIQGVRERKPPKSNDVNGSINNNNILKARRTAHIISCSSCDHVTSEECELQRLWQVVRKNQERRASQSCKQNYLAQPILSVDDRTLLWMWTGNSESRCIPIRPPLWGFLRCGELGFPCRNKCGCGGSKVRAAKRRCESHTGAGQSGLEGGNPVCWGSSRHWPGARLSPARSMLMP